MAAAATEAWDIRDGNAATYTTAPTTRQLDLLQEIPTPNSIHSSDGRLSHSVGHVYPQIHISGNARVQLGDQLYGDTCSINDDRPHASIYADSSRHIPKFGQDPLPKPQVECVFLVPYAANVRFINRTAELNALNEYFYEPDPLSIGDDKSSLIAGQKSHRRAALYGLGGVGKTQIAIEFAYQHHARRPNHSVFWIHASTESWLRKSFQMLADTLNIVVDLNGQADVFTAVGAWLKKQVSHAWLMILDNADDAEMLFQNHSRLLDTISECSHGALLVTTRDKKVADRTTKYWKSVPVSTMSSEQSVELMNSFLFPDTPRPGGVPASTSSGASDLVEILYNLPLAVAQAAAFIKENSISPNEYLMMWTASIDAAHQLLSEEFPADGRQHFDTEIPNAVATTMMISLDHIWEKRPRAGQLLISISLLHNTSIDPSLLLQSGEQQASLAFVKAMGELQAFSLVYKNVDDGNYVMHGIVHHVLCSWRTTKIARAEVQATMPRVLNRLNAAFTKTSGKVDREAANASLPHALHFLREEQHLGIMLYSPDKLKLMSKVADHLLYQGRITESKEVREAKLCLCEAYLDSGADEIVRAKCEYAAVLEQLHQFAEAKRYCHEVLDAGKTNYSCIHGLVMLSSMHGKERSYEAALSYVRKAIEVSSTYLGEQHEETLALYFTKAEICQSFARVFPELAQHNLISIKKDLEWVIGRLSDQKSPDAAVTILGKQHLTNVLDALEMFEQSQSLSIEILASRRRTLGFHHLETFQATMNLAFCFVHQTKFDEAESTVTEALSNATPAINSHHLGRAKGLQMLAIIHEKRAEYLRAQDLEAEVPDRVEIDGPKPASPIPVPIAGRSYATGFYDIPSPYSLSYGSISWKSCQSAHELALTSSSKTQILDHFSHISPSQPEVSGCLNTGKHEAEALEHYRQALQYRLEVMDRLLASPGIEHPDTLQHILDTSKTSLCCFLFDKSKHKLDAEQAETMQREVLSVQEDILGPDHEDTSATKGILAITLHEMGKAEAAQPFASAAYDSRVALLGKSHRQTLTMQQVLAEIMNNQPRSQSEALRLIYICWERTLLAYGEDDPETKSRSELWSQWKRIIDPQWNSLQEAYNSASSASVLKSRMLDTKEGFKRVLAHNTLRFTVTSALNTPRRGYAFNKIAFPTQQRLTGAGGLVSTRFRRTEAGKSISQNPCL